MIEVERKYRLNKSEFEKIKSELLKIDPSTNALHQKDTVFLQGIDSFSEFSPGMPVVRIRTENNQSKLTYKKSINEHGDSIEHEVGIDDPSAMQSILLSDDYRIITAVIKDRVEVRQGDITYALDDVKNLGTFIEIEMLVESEAHISKAELEIKRAALGFGLRDDAIEVRKYDQLLLQPK